MFKFAPFQAPARYVWKDPDTNREFLASNKNELMTHIRNYRSQNQLSEIDYLAMSVEDYLCRLPENVGKCQEVVLKRGFFEYVSGAVNIVKNMFLGNKNMVDDSVAEARALICKECPKNVFPDKDMFVEWSDRLAEASTGGRKTSLNQYLGNCEICTCTNKVKIFAKGPFHIPDEMPEICWQRLEPELKKE